MEFSRQEYWSGFPFPSPGDLPDPGIEPESPALQADSLLYEPLICTHFGRLICHNKETLSYSGLKIKFLSLSCYSSEKSQGVGWSQSRDSSALFPHHVLDKSPMFNTYLSTYYVKGARDISLAVQWLILHLKMPGVQV